MDDPVLRESMGEFGRARVKRDLNWHVTSRNLVSAYAHLFAKGRVERARQSAA